MERPAKDIAIHSVLLCSWGDALGGGGTCAHELIVRWARTYLCVNYFGHTTSFKECETNSNLQVVNLFENSPKVTSKVGFLLLYCMVMLRSLRLIKRFAHERNVIVTHSDAWPDTLFGFLLKLRNRNAYWIAINHMILPSPWKGYRYAYTNKIRVPSLIDIYGWFNQRLFFLLQKKADLLVSINENDKKYLLTKNRNVLIVRYGREYTGAADLSGKNKIYDICFLGRFYEQKGIDEIPDILKNLRRIYDKPLSIVFIGSKNAYSHRLERKLGAMNLGYDISFVGPKYGREKYDLLCKSRILILPSYFESFAIVYLDAISVGTPVVEYDLPCFVDHKYGVVKAPFKDNAAFAEGLKKLLVDDVCHSKLSLEGYQYSQEFSWDETARIFERYFLEAFRPAK